MATITPTPTPGSTTWMRPLGRTGLRVSAVCAGGSPLGAVPRLEGQDISEDRGVVTARTILASPIRTIDTSNGYGGGWSEHRIGQAIALSGGLPDDAIVVTKVDPRRTDFSGDRVRASLAESRDRLGLDVLPLVHLHDPDRFDFDEMTAPGGAVEALVALKEAGQIGAIGVAGGDVHEIARYVALDVFDALLIHNRWTLLDRSAGPLIDQALERGMGVFNAAVYGGGILASAGGPDAPTTYGYRPAPPEVLNAVAAMRRACAEHGTDLATAALQFSVRDDRFASTVVGMSRPERVDQTLAAVAYGVPDELVEELESLLPDERFWLDAVGGPAAS